MRKTLILSILLIVFLKFSSHVFAIPGGVSGKVLYQLPDGTRGPLPGVKISRMELWGWGANYCRNVPDQYKSDKPDHCWGYFHTVETTSDNEGKYTMANEGNNPAPIAAKKEEYEDGSYTIITKCLRGEKEKVPVCRITPTNAPIIPSTSYIDCPDHSHLDRIICVDPPIKCRQFNWCGFSCGYIEHRWGPYFPEGYRLPRRLEEQGYSHLRGRWYRYNEFGNPNSGLVGWPVEYFVKIGNSGNYHNADFIFILDPPPTPTPTSTPYLVIKVKDVNGNSRLAEKMALTYSCPGGSFCRQGDVSLKSEATFPYSGGSNKGGGIVVRSFHQLLGVTPIPNTGGSLRAMSVPCNGINCPEIWQNYWWDNFPNTGQASLDYVVYVYPAPSLGKLIIKADDTEDSTSGPYGFSGMREEDSGIVNGIAQFGRNQYNYLVVGQVINSNIQSSQNLNPDPKANIGLGGVIFGPRGAVSFNPNDPPASILEKVRNSKGFIMLYSEKSIPISGRKHLLSNSTLSNSTSGEIKNNHLYLYVPKNEFDGYHWVEMNTRLSHKILSNYKEVFKLKVAESMRKCYDSIDEKTLVPCFELYFYSGFLSNQPEKIHEWGTYGYVYDHLRDQNFIEKKDPNQN